MDIEARSEDSSAGEAPSARSKALRDEILGSALSLDEAAYVLGLDRTTVAKYLRDNTLVGFQIGREWRIPEDELRDYVRRLIDERRRAASRDERPGAPIGEAGQPGWLERVRSDFFGSRRRRSGDRSDRFTPRARAALGQADEEAIRLNHQFIGTEHLLLALVSPTADNQRTALRLLHNLGIAPEQIYREVEARIGHGETQPDTARVGLTTRARKAIELAVDEARRLRQREVGTEDLLLGLIREGDGIAAAVLRQFGLTLDVARAETRRLLSASARPANGETAL